LKLADWSRDNYYRTQDEVMGPTLKVAEEVESKGLPRTGAKFPDFVDTIERVQYNELTEEKFIELFEFGSKPVIIQGVADDWKGLTDWKMGRLIERFGESKFKIGESDSGKKLKVTLN